MFYYFLQECLSHIMLIQNSFQDFFLLSYIMIWVGFTLVSPFLAMLCLNGESGLYFGYLYRRYGIAYAKMVHGSTNLIFDVIRNIVFIAL